MLRTGKLAPKRDYRTLLFKNYAAALPAPPPTVDNVQRVLTNLKLPASAAPSLFPIDFNDQYGDCTIAGLAHVQTLFNGLIGKKKIPTAASVKSLYFKLSGGQDTGLVELDVLNYWRKSGAFSEKLLAYTKLDPHNHTQVQQAISMYGSAYIGFQVQANAIPDFEAHKTWTPGKLTQDGHAVVAVAYDQQTVTVLTWGGLQKGTWAWWDECVDESFCLLPPEAQHPGFAPGFDFAQLQADLAAL